MHQTSFETLSIVVPAYNEAPTIGRLLEKVIAAALPDAVGKQLIIVDDCSTDGTFRVLSEFKAQYPDSDIIVLQHDKNQGKGAALHTGISAATGQYLIIQDADLEYDPNEFRILMQPVLDGFADVVYGSRFMGGNAHRVLFFWHTVGNKFLTNLSNMFTNLNLTDMETCYKLFDTKMLQSVRLREKRFGFEPEVTAQIARIPKIRIYEVGISYYGRTYAEGKKIDWKDGLHAIWCIVRYGLFR